jgi:signal transduction histidine kinase
LTGFTGLGGVRVVENGSDGSVWVGTTTGLVRFKDGRQVRYGLHGELASPFVTALHLDHHGALWIATDRGVTQFKDERFVPVSFPITPRTTRVYSMTTDSQGRLWLCDSNQGLFRWAGDTLAPFDVPSQLDHRHVTSVHGDAADRVWILQSGGALGVVDHDGSFRVVNSGGFTPSTVHQDRGDGVMWVGGLQGAGRFSDARLVTVGEKNGLPTAGVTAIVPGADGHVWLGTRVGILRVATTVFDTVDKDPSVKVNYTLYDSEDGMAGSPVGSGVPAAVRAADGRLWFVTTNGVTIVDPRSIRDGATIPPVHIEGVVADARRLRPTRDLSLPPLTSTIEIGYSAVTFSSPKKVRYRYRLDGFDRDWRDVGTRREALYTNLPPGRYRFRVAAANNENGFGVDGASIDFTILPTFYQTAWFYGVCALTITLVLWLAWKLRVRYLHREFSLVLGERVRVSREIHDTLLQSLVGVALQLDALAESAGPLDSMKATLATTRREVEEYIRETRRSIWNLRSPKLERGDLAAALRHAGDRMTSGTPVQFTLTATGQTRRLETDVEQQLLRIGEQAMLNSVRHANATEVHLKLQYEEDAVLLRVSDNGRGFDATELAGGRSQHYGLVGMKERTEQAGGGLNIVTHPGGGTAVEIVIPVTSDRK